jgi:hypothetical protein
MSRVLPCFAEVARRLPQLSGNQRHTTAFGPSHIDTVYTLLMVRQVDDIASLFHEFVKWMTLFPRTSGSELCLLGELRKAILAVKSFKDSFFSKVQDT